MHIPIRLLCLLAGVAALGPAHAETAPFAEDGVESSWTITPAVTSQYLFRGVKVADAAFQPTVEYGRGPLTLGLWASAALEEQESGDSDPEIDLYGSYTFTLPDSNLEIVPGFALYTYPGARRSNGLYSATFEPSLAVNVETKGIRFTPKCYYDTVLKGATFELTAATAVPLTSLGTTLELSASVGTFRWSSVTADASPDEKNWGDYWTVGASLPYQITTNGQLALGVLYSEGHNNYYKQGTAPKVPNESAVGRAAVTLSYSISL
jgi:uncharacterized protein (TIGR02001 family)